MRLLKIFLLTLVSTTTFGQDYFTFEQTTTDKLKAIEKQFKSRQLETRRVHISESYYPHADKYEVGFPISYLRTKDTLINNCMVEYFFTEADSKLRIIFYDWDETQRTDKLADLPAIMKVEKRRFNAYNAKYDQLFKIISDKLGKPALDEKLKEVKWDESTYKERTSKWKADNVTVTQNLIFTTSDNDLGTYRVRVIIYWD